MSLKSPGETQPNAADDLACPLAPPPSPTLLNAVASMRPVVTRVPVRAVFAILTVALLYPLGTLLWMLPRLHLHPATATWVVALVWAGAVAWLARAVLPAAGQVLPDTTRAGYTTAAVIVGLVSLCLLTTSPVPSTTSFLHDWWHCAFFSVRVTVPALVVALFALRGLFPIGSVRIGAAIGAAGAALAGLTLHFICPFGGRLHVALAHGGGVLLGASLGALVLSRRLRAKA